MSHRIRKGAVLLAASVFGGALFAVRGADPQRDANSVYEITCHYCHDNGIGPVLKGTQRISMRPTTSAKWATACISLSPPPGPGARMAAPSRSTVPGVSC